MKINMEDKERIINEFKKILDDKITNESAEYLLDATNWDIERAIDFFFYENIQEELREPKLLS
jgi:hypothetical protein